jgi:hypothetical protein
MDPPNILFFNFLSSFNVTQTAQGNDSLWVVGEVNTSTPKEFQEFQDARFILQFIPRSPRNKVGYNVLSIFIFG